MAREKRTAIFAHYDANNVIGDFVVYYLSQLKKNVDKLIFVSDCDIKDEELKKIESFVDYKIAKRHGEYDFGSYKRGFLLAQKEGLLNDCDELIFANDSCYGPLYPFEDIFNDMKNKENDFWGIVFNDIGLEYKNGNIEGTKLPHLQSYFLVFKPKVFNSELFKNFITSIKSEPDKFAVVIKYEMGLSKLLIDNGFKYDVYCNSSKYLQGAHLNAYYHLVAFDKCPFLKRSIVLYKFIDCHYPVGIKKLIKKYTKYDYDLILKDTEQNGPKIELSKNFKFFLKSYRRHVLRILFKKKLLCLFGHWYKF